MGWQVCDWHPVHIVVDAQLDFAGVGLDFVCVQFDNPARICCVFCNGNQVAHLGIYPQFFGQFTLQACWAVCAIFKLTTGVFPFARKRLGRRPASVIAIRTPAAHDL